MDPQPLVSIDSGLLDFLSIVTAIVAGGFLIPVLCAIVLWIGLLIQTKNGSRISRPTCPTVKWVVAAVLALISCGPAR